MTGHSTLRGENFLWIGGGGSLTEMRRLAEEEKAVIVGETIQKLIGKKT